MKTKRQIKTKQQIFSTREVAELLGSREWRVRRLFEDGTLPEPKKFGGKRAIPQALIPAIESALRERGWLIDPAVPVVNEVVAQCADSELPSDIIKPDSPTA